MQRRQRTCVITCGPYRLALASRPHIMGIVNITPDSFSDGGKCLRPQAAYRHALRLVEEGADILDLGAESTRPGAPEVSVQEEIRRLRPALKLIRRLSVPISVDTTKPEVAAMALESGAHILNDVMGVGHAEMHRLAARSGAPLVIMHMQGTPRTMQAAPRYRNVVKEVKAALLTSAQAAEDLGVKPNKIILDPGIGFGKTVLHNLQLLQRLAELTGAGYPVLVGPSRKSFITKTVGPLSPTERDWGTSAAVAASVAGGAHIVRVHAVAAMRIAANVAWAIAQARIPQTGAKA